MSYSDFKEQKPSTEHTTYQLRFLLKGRTTYHKLRRRGSFDFPVLSVAVALRQADDGTCTAARIVLGAVASAPLRATEAEKILLGTKIDEDAIMAAAESAFQLAKPLDNTDMTIAYRKQMTRVYVAKALRETVQMEQIKRSS